MNDSSEDIPGYAYGSDVVPTSPVSMQALEELKISAGFTAEDHRLLRLAGDILEDQAKKIVEHWRSGIIAGIPHLARHSRTPEGKPIPEYLSRTNRRFEQWILDTCRRPYDQDWLNYQHAIALRHTSLLKNNTDGVRSTPFVPLRDAIGFVAVMNETIKPYLGAKGASIVEVEQMYSAWCKSIQLQLALWTIAYVGAALAPNEL